MIRSLELEQFSAFRKARLDFADGINVFIGANGTGKSHAMKVLYATLRAAEQASTVSLENRLTEKLANVFRPDDGNVARLVRRVQGKNKGSVKVTAAKGRNIHFTLHTAGAAGLKLVQDNWKPLGNAIFLPTREVLAMFEGFVAAYTRRELSFDETYFDAAVALGGALLKGPRPAETTKLLQPMEEALGGRVLLKHNRFYVALPDGYMEAHLVAEGLRKIAAIAYLVANGSLADKSVLFWDEPEANLNPKLTSLVIKMLLELAKQGVQVFLTTHDYLLSQQLSLRAEYGQTDKVDISFFSFARNDDGDVDVFSGATLTELPANPIVEEFAKHYDFERDMFRSPVPAARRKAR